MDCNVVESEMADRDGGECVVCSCDGSLDVLKEVQRAYEERMEMIITVGGPNLLQKQVKLLQRWVSDLVAQNALLARTVEQLEEDVTARVLLERRRHAETESEARAEAAALRRQLARKDGDLRGLLEVLRRLRDPAQPRHCALTKIHFNEVTQSDIFGPDLWEIRRLNQNTEQYEQVVMSLKKEMSLSKRQTPPDSSTLDVGVTADICCPGLQIEEIEPVKENTSLLRKETAKYRERLEHIEEKVKSSSERVRALREANVALLTEAHTLRQLCVALGEQGRLAHVRTQYAKHLVREMRGQIIQAKAKLKAHEESCLKVTKEMALGHDDRNTCNTCNSNMSAGEPCVGQQPRRSLRRRPHLDRALELRGDCSHER